MTIPACTCGDPQPTPTQHSLFCPWREWWLSTKPTDLNKYDDLVAHNEAADAKLRERLKVVNEERDARMRSENLNS